MDPGMVPSFIARVGNGKMSAFSSLYLISDKEKGHFWCIEMLRLFFCFHIVVAKYYSSIPEMVYHTAANR